MIAVSRALSTAFLLCTLAACGSDASTRRAGGDPGQRPRAASIVARGRVDVEGGVLPLALAIDGIVLDVDVAEGQEVRRGTVLLRADPAAARIDADLARAHLDAALSQVKLMESRVAASKSRAARLAQAAKLDAGDGQSADDARDAAQQAIAELDAAHAGVEVAGAERERADRALSQLQLTAPTDGELLRVNAWPGMRLSAQGTTVATLLPSRPRIIRVELPEEYADVIGTGRVAEVLGDDGRLTRLARAHVLRLSPMSGASQLQDDPEQRLDQRSIEAVLGIDEAPSLRVGQRVLVRFSADGGRH